MTQTTPPAEEIQQQAGKVLAQLAGYIGVRTIEMGLRHGLFEEFAKHPEGITDDALAQQTGMDPLYTQVWCRSAFASEVLELGAGGAYKLAPHMDKLLLDHEFPGYIGGMPTMMVQPELFDFFGERLRSGDRIWWDQCSPAWIQAVSGTARPFYSRLIPGGLERVPGLSERLAQNAKVLDLGCGAGIGLEKLARAYPNVSLAGLDGDEHSLQVTERRLKDAGLRDASLVASTFEDFDARDEYDVVIINVSMHECRDMEKTAKNVHNALKPDGYFVISDMPFPDSTEGTRTVPARIMSGIQFFEALIDDQLLPTQAFVDLLNKQGFRNVGAFDLAPVHAVTHGQK